MVRCRPRDLQLVKLLREGGRHLATLHRPAALLSLAPSKICGKCLCSRSAVFLLYVPSSTDETAGVLARPGL